MNTFQLSCFLTVANTLNFAQAAKQVNISQPAITKQIKSLEKELGTKLFYRTTRMVELTPDGQAFVEDAQNIVAIAKQTTLRFGRTGEEIIENISIACDNCTLLASIPEILKELSATCTNLHPKLSVVPRNQLRKLLETEMADVLFDLRAANDKMEKYTFKELKQCELVCVCSKDHPLAKRTVITRADLKDETLIFCNPMNVSPDIANLQWQLVKEKSPARSHYCDSSETAVLLAASGLGIALLPELMVTDDSRILTIKTEDSPKLSFGMFYKSRPESDVVRRFLQITKRYFDARTEHPKIPGSDFSQSK